MEKLKLKSVKITFKDGSTITYEDLVNFDHIETDMMCCERVLRIKIIHNKLDNELQHTEIYTFNIETIASIIQRWL